MYLKKTFRKETGRTYLVIAKKTRDPDTGVYSDTTVESIGYLDELIEKYQDPISHFKELARKMTEEEKAGQKSAMEIDMEEELPTNFDGWKNFGYAAILKVYHELELHRFFNNKARHQGFEYNTNSIMTLLVIARVLSPGSKLKAFESKDRYFERFNFSLHDVYRSLTHFSEIAKDAQRHINERIATCYGRDTSVVYYDVTNFYFEIDKEDNLRKRGVSKEKKRDPIVQMGLAMDADGLPLHYELFPGNTLDKQTFRSVIGEVRRNYDTGRIIVVADMGVITGDNIYYLIGDEKRKKPLNGYVFGFSVRGGADSFKQYALDQKGYLDQNGEPATADADFKMKSRLTPREINVTMSSGKTETKTVHEKQVVFWSRKYADKAKAEREAVIRKAMAMVNEPRKYNQASSYGATKYVKNMEFDKKTGEALLSDKILCLDGDKIREEELFDGYYSIATSEMGMSDQEIIDAYRGLWEIEETFSVVKGDLGARPVFVSLEDHINAHFLSCFIALVIMRILQKQTGRRFSCERIADCLNRIVCVNTHDNVYRFCYRGEISDAIGKAFGVDFTKKWLRLGEIKSEIALSKK